MVLKKFEMKKMQYSIREVAEMFDVNESTLRFWEKEFSIIRPHKTPKGTRYYRPEDIESVRLVHHLVKERGMTLEGARKKIKDNPEKTAQNEDIVNRLKSIKIELKSIIQAFDDINKTSENNI